MWVLFESFSKDTNYRSTDLKNDVCQSGKAINSWGKVLEYFKTKRQGHSLRRLLQDIVHISNHRNYGKSPLTIIVMAV